MSRILRVFPRKTMATPDDALAICDEYPGLYVPDCDEVQVSVSFTYDIEKAEKLAEAWRVIGVPVTVGGPAYGEPGAEFTPGLYLRNGWVITSRGCPNNCWFCYVPKREGKLRELEVHNGHILQDNNLLACSTSHVNAVFDMLERQPTRAEFRGGIDPKLVEDWHCQRLYKLRPKIVYTAYDTPDDYEPLVEMAKKLWRSGNTPTSQAYRVYVLVAYPRDTVANAVGRLERMIDLGYRPYPMMFQDDVYRATPSDWKDFRATWGDTFWATRTMLARWRSSDVSWRGMMKAKPTDN